MDKKFVVNEINFDLGEWALRAAFGYAITDGRMSLDEARERFDALEIGEMLVDEDGDTWERIA